MKKSVAFKLAGAAALAGSTQAYGQIVLITPSNLPSDIPGNAPTTTTTETYDVLAGLTNAGSPDFSFHYQNSTSYYQPTGNTYYIFSTSISNLKGGSAITSTFSNPYAPFLYANALTFGAKIGTDTNTFQQPILPLGTPQTYLVYAVDGSLDSPQQTNTPTYLGFQFTDSADGELHDGWLEIESATYNSPTDPGGLLFMGGAYNSIADTGDGTGDILAGEVPEPGTISSLILGAAALGGVGLLRRRRSLFPQD